MKVTWHRALFTSVLAAVLAFALANLAVAQRGGGGGRGGGGARVSAARAGGGRSLPSNYGSVQSSSHSMSRPSQPARPAVDRAPDVRRNLNANDYRGESRSIDTRRGGEVNVGVTQAGSVVARGETARGRDYGFANSRDGDRIVVGRTADGDVAVRAKGDYDGTLNNLPDHCATVVVGGYTYYRHGHDYYWPYYYGGSVYYQEIYPPVDAVTAQVPPGADLVVVDGVEYLVVDGVYYQKQGDAYRVVDGLTAAVPALAAVSPDPGELLRSMTAYLGSLSNFVVDCTEKAVSAEKGNEIITTKRRLFVSRPQRIAAAALEGGDQRRFWYDGKHATVLDLAKKIYASVEVPPTMSEAFDVLRDEYGLNLPLADLLRPDVAEAILVPANALTYAGKENIGEVLCHKLTLMNDELKGALWIEAVEKTPRPRKIDLLYYTHPGKPRYQAVIDRWDAKETIDDNLFVFKPPADAARIEMVSRADD